MAIKQSDVSTGSENERIKETRLPSIDLNKLSNRESLEKSSGTDSSRSQRNHRKKPKSTSRSIPEKSSVSSDSSTEEDYNFQTTYDQQLETIPKIPFSPSGNCSNLSFVLHPENQLISPRSGSMLSEMFGQDRLTNASTKLKAIQEADDGQNGIKQNLKRSREVSDQFEASQKKRNISVDIVKEVQTLEDISRNGKKLLKINRKLESNVEDLLRRIDELNKEMEKMKQKCSRLETDNEELKNENERLRRDLDEARKHRADENNNEPRTNRSEEQDEEETGFSSSARISELEALNKKLTEQLKNFKDVINYTEVDLLKQKAQVDSNNTRKESKRISRELKALIEELEVIKERYDILTEEKEDLQIQVKSHTSKVHHKDTLPHRDTMGKSWQRGREKENRSPIQKEPRSSNKERTKVLDLSHSFRGALPGIGGKDSNSGMTSNNTASGGSNIVLPNIKSPRKK